MKSALIICGGSGTRLVTDDIKTPKSLLMIDGETIIFTQISNLYLHGFRDFYFMLAQNSFEISHHLNSIKFNFPGANFVLLFDSNLKGTAGGILTNLESLPNEFVIVYGDIYMNVDFSHIIQQIEFNYDLILVYRATDHPQDSNLIVMDSNKKVIELTEKGLIDFDLTGRKASVGIMFCKKSVFTSLSSSFKNMVDLERDIIQKHISSLNIYGLKLKGYAKDIGTKYRFLRVKSDVKQKIHLVEKSGIIFLDRDGTINRDVGFFSDINMFQILTAVPKAINLINKSKFYAVVVSNQSGIARGITSFQEVLSLHEHLNSELLHSGSYVDNLYFCPHHPDSGFPDERIEHKVVCNCRKPRPGLLNQALRDYEIDSKDCWLVGDAERDVLAAKSIMMKNILIPTNQNFFDYTENLFGEDYYNNDLASAIERIIDDCN